MYFDLIIWINSLPEKQKMFIYFIMVIIVLICLVYTCKEENKKTMK